MAASLVAAPCATSRVLVRRLWCLWASSCAALAPEGRLRCSTVSARPETLGGRRGRIWLTPTSYVCRRPLRARWGRRTSISRCCAARGRLTGPAGRRRLAARPETLGGRRGEDLAGADKLRVSEAFAFALGAESIDLEMLRNSGTSDRARRPPAAGGAIRPETPRRGRAGRQVRLGGYGRHHWAFSRSGAPMPPPPPMRPRRRASSQGAVTTRRCALALRHRLRSHGGATAPADAPSRPDAPGRRVRRKISHVRCCQKSISRWIFGLLPLIFG